MYMYTFPWFSLVYMNLTCPMDREIFDATCMYVNFILKPQQCWKHTVCMFCAPVLCECGVHSMLIFTFTHNVTCTYMYMYVYMHLHVRYFLRAGFRHRFSTDQWVHSSLWHSEQGDFQAGVPCLQAVFLLWQPRRGAAVWCSAGHAQPTQLHQGGHGCMCHILWDTF